MKSIDAPKCRKAELHVHAKYSGFFKYSPAQLPDSIFEADMVVKDAMKGIDVTCIIDHDGALEAQKYAAGLSGIDVIKEVSKNEGEMIGLILQEKRVTVERIYEQGI